MDPRQALTERNAHFTRGPRFFREDGAVMFEFVIDAGNILGPRPATKADSLKHDEAWAEFTRAEALSDLARADAELLDTHEYQTYAGYVELTVTPEVVEQNQGPPAKRAYRRKTQAEETVS